VKSTDDLTAPLGPDPSANYKQRQGDVPNYKPGMFERDIDPDILALAEPNQLTKVLTGRRGYYVVQLVERKPVKFEDVRNALYKAALEKPANAGEIYEMQQRLREKAEVLKAKPKKQ
jgi:parvulin-like peptidyl-prolyl isomerase